VAWSCVKGDGFKRLPLLILTHADLRGRLGRPGRLQSDTLDEQVEAVNRFKPLLDVRSLSRSTEARALTR
jgi:hypothetical protein